MKIIAIDSDMAGGVALVGYPQREVVALRWMPCREDETGKHVDAQQLYAVLKSARQAGAVFAVIEGVFVNMSNQRTPMAGAHNQMQNYGAIRALAQLALGPDRVVRAWPSAWKKTMGLSKDKDKSLSMATDLFPGHASLFRFKKNAGLAEALLLAEWHWQKNCTHVHEEG